MHDQMTQTNYADRRSKSRFYLRIGFNLLEQAIVHTRIAWKTFSEDIPAKNFRLKICQGMVSKHTRRNRNPAVIQEWETFRETHLPKLIPRARCVICSAQKLDLKSFWGCTGCPGADCINVNRNCFTSFHQSYVHFV